MWQIPKQKGKSSNRKPNQGRLPVHVKRINASVQIVAADTQKARQIGVRVILNDISMNGMGFFSQEALVPGQEALITIHEPAQLNIKGVVRWCQQHTAGSHVLSSKPFGYRLGIEFVLADEKERKTVQSFFEALVGNMLYSPKSF